MKPPFNKNVTDLRQYVRWGYGGRNAIGELSAELEKVQGKNLPNVPPWGHSGKREAIKAAGLSKSVVHRCEQIAGIPEEVFERHIAAKKEKGLAVTVKDVIQTAGRKRCELGIWESICCPSVPGDRGPQGFFVPADGSLLKKAPGGWNSLDREGLISLSSLVFTPHPAGKDIGDSRLIFSPKRRAPSSLHWHCLSQAHR